MAIASSGPLTGHCGVTNPGGDCNAGELGSWDTGAIGVNNLEECAAHCLASCPRCAFISFHAGHKDCSWYSRCAKLHFSFGGAEYRSKQVRAPTSFFPPPPPPPAFVVPPGAAPGFCTLMDPSAGDCESPLSDQGSWPDADSPDECIRRCAGCRRCHFVSFTLSRLAEGVRPIGGARNHGPFWWRCRWYRRCAMDDLRATPPGTEAYYTLRRRGGGNQTELPRGVRRGMRAALRGRGGGGGRRGGSRAAGPPEAAETLAEAQQQLLRERGSSPSSPASASVATPVSASTPASASASVSVSISVSVSVGIAALVDFDPSWRSYGGVDAECAMAQWCQNAARLQGLLPSHWRTAQLVLSEDAAMARRLARASGCGALRLVPIEPELRGAAEGCVAKIRSEQRAAAAAAAAAADAAAGTAGGSGGVGGRSGGARAEAAPDRLDDIDGKSPRSKAFFKRISLHKWQVLGLVEFDVVIFADADLELVPLGEHDPRWVAQAWRAAVEALLRSSYRILADADLRSPLNAGLLLARPSRALFAEGLATLRACRFNRADGWNASTLSSFASSSAAGGGAGGYGGGGRRGGLSRRGTPPPTRLSGRRAHANARRLWRRGDWDFIGADQDQGLLYFVLYVRRHLGAYGAGGYKADEREGLPLSRHWWAGFKPFMELREAAQSVGRGRYADVLHLAKLYDYVVREYEPRLAAGRRAGGGGRPLPRCLADSRALRHAIERHAHFDEVFHWWQQHHWTGDGYAAWPTLPAEPVENAFANSS